MAPAQDGQVTESRTPQFNDHWLRRAVLRVRSVLALPASALARLRLGLVLCGLLLILGTLATLGEESRQDSLDLVVGVGVIWLAWFWVRSYTNVRLALLWLIPEGMVLLAVGLAAGSVPALGLFSIGLCLRALTGIGRQWWLGVLTYVAAYSGTLLLAPRGEPEMWLSPWLLSPLCAVLLAAGLARLLALSAAGHEASARRATALARSGGELGAATTHQQIYERAQTLALALLDRRPVKVSLRSQAAEQAVTPTDRGRRLPWQRSVHAATLAAWAGAGTALVVTSRVALSVAERQALATLGSQAELALTRLELAEELEQGAGEERFKSLVQQSSDVITIIGVDGNIRYQALSISKVLGYRPAELIGRKLTDYVHPEDLPRASQLFAEMLEPRWVSPPVEWRIRHRDDSWRHVETIATNLLDDPNVGGIVLNTRDVSDRKALEERLVEQAFHDPLTKLANRALLRDRLEHALTTSKRTRQPLAVLFLDLDNFKTINDSLGHDAGDAMLLAVTERLRGALRAADTAARLGGDEFAILLEDLTYGTEATTLAERIATSLQAPFVLAGKEVFVGTSIGIALSASGQETADDMLRNADVAMYMAKSQGKGGAAVFEPSMHAAALARLELHADLQRAVQRQEFALHYQPIVGLDTGRIVGVEALLRWPRPEEGVRLPAEFIHSLEETGLILPLGRWLLREACVQLRTWQLHFPANPPLTVAVNLSARQFQQPSLADDVAMVLRETGVAAHSLVLEITESNLMQDTEAAIGKMRALKALGIQLAIDDFGTGYSSLSYLQHFPLDILKIDKSFVAGVGKGADAAALTNTIITLGTALKLRLVAEGIEVLEQWRELPGPGCHLGQGFYFGRPCTPGEMTALLAEASADPSWWTRQQRRLRPRLVSQPAEPVHADVLAHAGA